MIGFLCFRTPGLLKQFVADLHSGKLHREFHHGPDPTPAQIESQDVCLTLCFSFLATFHI